MKLRFIIRDDGPFVFMGEPPRHRSVDIALTEDQVRQLKLERVGQIGNTTYYEEISQVFVEREVKANP